MVAQREYHTPSAPSSSDSPWILDTGATNHVTADSSHLHDYSPYSGSDKLCVGNGNSIPIKNTGSSYLITPHNKFILNYVLHAPKITHNLLSVHKLLTDNNCAITFTKSSFFVKDIATSNILLTGSHRDGLYQINESSANSVSPLFAFLGVKSTSALWHSRLGHPSTYVFHKISSLASLPIEGPKTFAVKCSSCLCAKSKRLPFNLCSLRTTAPLQIVHSDVWGPSHSISNEGYLYYINFVDDWSRFTWIFPITHKSEFLVVFTRFKLMVENQFDCKIKIL
ncbi:hypothetical protein ACHQM5_002794 [Ranunculus cassubicifolius]